MLDSLGKKGMIVDDFSELEVVSDTAEITGDYEYFSLLNISGEAAGITVTGAAYCVSDAELTCDFPLGVSNEFTGPCAEISVAEGALLVTVCREEQSGRGAEGCARKA